MMPSPSSTAACVSEQRSAIDAQRDGEFHTQITRQIRACLHACDSVPVRTDR